jgi:hypothetical protein
MSRLDRDKYISILKSEGLSSAITSLHHDMWELEKECFEGRAGWQPELFADIQKFREFSIELWDQRFDVKN